MLLLFFVVDLSCGEVGQRNPIRKPQRHNVLRSPLRCLLHFNRRGAQVHARKPVPDICALEPVKVAPPLLLPPRSALWFRLSFVCSPLWTAVSTSSFFSSCWVCSIAAFVFLHGTTVRPVKVAPPRLFLLSGFNCPMFVHSFWTAVCTFSCLFCSVCSCLSLLYFATFVFPCIAPLLYIQHCTRKLAWSGM